ncbi:MAG: purine-nucleoside phosphorylase [Thermoanaerobaculia bacterium]|nr:purine-nucleoside phosphorylase [Thermoanaerobaculia bacterium]
MEQFEIELAEAERRWEGLGWPGPRVLLVSGSGLAVDLAGRRHGETELAELLPFPTRTVVGHPHRVELLYPRDDLPLLYQRGRLHSYQGYDGHRVALMVRLAARRGAELLIMTNAAGGLDPEMRAGDLALIRDHLNLTGLNPLTGDPPADWGPRFPDMTNAYDRELAALAHRTADGLGIPLRDGVYAGLAGPNFETPAEVRMLRTLGADLAGMSTVLEVIAARHLGMRCLCLSLVANPAAGVTDEPLDHEEVLEAGRAAAEKVRRLLDGVLAAL